MVKRHYLRAYDSTRRLTHGRYKFYWKRSDTNVSPERKLRAIFTIKWDGRRTSSNPVFFARLGCTGTSTSTPPRSIKEACRTDAFGRHAMTKIQKNSYNKISDADVAAAPQFPQSGTVPYVSYRCGTATTSDGDIAAAPQFRTVTVPFVSYRCGTVTTRSSHAVRGADVLHISANLPVTSR